MTVVDDLAAWLTQIWDEREREASDPYWNTTDGLVSSGEVLARIAADRQIVAKWQQETSIEYAMGDGGADLGLEYAMRCLALPHADRPGYQEAWRPA